MVNNRRPTNPPGPYDVPMIPYVRQAPGIGCCFVLPGLFVLFILASIVGTWKVFEMVAGLL